MQSATLATYPVLVKELDCGDKSKHNSAGFSLGELFLFNNSIQEFTASHKFQN